MLRGNEKITRADVDGLTRKLSEFAETLSDKEKKTLSGVLELAGKMYEGTGSKVTPRKLSLEREVVRDLNVWDRLIETQGHSLWTCPRPPDLGDEVIINPVD
jgi:hypothetical protein